MKEIITAIAASDTKTILHVVHYKPEHEVMPRTVKNAGITGCLTGRSINLSLDIWTGLKEIPLPLSSVLISKNSKRAVK